MDSLLADLKACSTAKNLQMGKKLHAFVIQNGQDSNIHVASTLVDMYAKCGSMVDACNFFDKMPLRNVVTWTVLISGYAENGEESKALELFARMQGSCTPDAVTFVAILGTCTSLATGEEFRCRERCMTIHSYAVKCRCDMDLRVGSKLVNIYSKCGSMTDARKLFDAMPLRNVVVWNTLLLGYAENGEGLEALELLYCMEREGIAPDAVTFIALLKACFKVSTGKHHMDVEMRVMKIHFHSACRFCDSDVRVASTLVDMYTKCRRLVDARKIFDSMSNRNAVTWTALMLGYVENGDSETSLELFSHMDCQPDALTFVAALKACTSLANSEKLMYGMIIQSHVVTRGLDSDIRVANTLVDMYAKCGSMKDAQNVFNRMLFHNVVTWNTLLLGYVENGESEVALNLLSEMEGCVPDSLTYISALKACAAVGALEMVKMLETKARFDDNTILVNVYAKCGSMDDALRIFDSISVKTLLTWNALMAGYAFHGDTECLFDVFRGMREARIRPNGLTFLCILSACNHSGFIDLGKEYFETMSLEYGVLPDIEHYHCMIDMLGRANKLDDASALIKRMPFVPTRLTWRTFLGACQKWKNVDLGKLAFESLSNLGDHEAGNFVSIVNICRDIALQETSRST